MKNIFKALILLLAFGSSAHAAKIAVTVGNGSLQPGTTAGFNVSSGTVVSFNPVNLVSTGSWTLSRSTFAFTNAVMSGTVFDNSTNTYTGGNTYVMLKTSSASITGSLDITPNTSQTNAVTISTAAPGTWGISITTASIYTNKSQPMFLIQQTAVRTDITGDGTIVPLTWDTITKDVTNDFSGSTATIRYTGIYHIECQVTMQNLLAAHTNFGIGISVNGNYLTGGSYRKVYNLTGNAMTLFSLSVDAIAPFTAGDKLMCAEFASGSTKTVDGGGDASYEYFYGVKLE